MVHFVGAGPGAPDLITRRGAALLQKADCIIYAGSLVNPALLGLAKADCAIYNSAEMTLEQVLDVMRQMEAAGKITVRLHTGDPCLYGAIRELMDALDADGIAYDDTPGVSSFCGAAAALGRGNRIVGRAVAALARLVDIGPHEFAQHLGGGAVFQQSGVGKLGAQFRLNPERHLHFFGHGVYLFQKLAIWLMSQPLF